MSGGGTIGDFMSWGYIPAQHHDSEYDESCRLVPAMARRVRSTDKWEAPELERNSGGDWLGLHLWEREGTRRQLSGWASCWSAVVSGAVSRSRQVDSESSSTITKATQASELRVPFALRPNRGQDRPDARFEEKPPQHWPPWKSKSPKGWPGTVTSATADEYVQEDVWHPDFVGLVASNRGAADYSTHVIDLEGTELDEEWYAPLHTLVSVERIKHARADFGIQTGRVLALQLGSTGQKDANSGGLANFGATMGALARSSGGPLCAAPTHPIALTEDAHQVNAAGLQTLALWRQLSSGNTGPLEFHGTIADLSGASNAGVTTAPDGSRWESGTVTKDGGYLEGVVPNAAPEATAHQCQVLYNPDAEYPFGATTRTGTWQIWCENGTYDDSAPLDGSTRPRDPADPTRPRDNPPGPTQSNPDGLRRILGGLPGGGIPGVFGFGGGGVAAGGAGFFGVGGRPGGVNPLQAGFGIPQAPGGGSKRVRRRDPRGGFGLPPVGGGGRRGFGGKDDGVGKHTDHNRGRDDALFAKYKARKARQRAKRIERLEDRINEAKVDKKFLDEKVWQKHLERWEARLAREKERQDREAREEAKRAEKKAAREQERRDKERARKKKEAEREEAWLKKQWERGRDGFSKYGGTIGSGDSIPGAPDWWNKWKRQQWADYIGMPGTDAREFSIPNKWNFLGGVGFRANAYRVGEPGITLGGALGAAGVAQMRGAPQVGYLAAYGVNDLGGWQDFDYTDTNSGFGNGTIALMPPDVDLATALRGDTISEESSNSVALLMPNGVGSLYFGEPHASTGGCASGVRMRSTSAVGLVWDVMTSAGAVAGSPQMQFGEGSLKVTGNCEVTGKLTVGGLIDPTGLVLAEQASDPMSGAQVGIYAGNTAGANEANWRRDDGSVINLAAVGGGTPYPIGAKVRRSAVQSINDSSLTSVLFDVELWDPNGYHSTVSNTERITPGVAGKYQVEGCISWAANGTGIRALYLVSNTKTLRIEIEQNPTAGQPTRQSVSDIVELGASDYVYLQGWQNSGGALNAGGAQPYESSLALQRVA